MDAMGCGKPLNSKEVFPVWYKQDGIEEWACIHRAGHPRWVCGRQTHKGIEDYIILCVDCVESNGVVW